MSPDALSSRHHPEREEGLCLRLHGAGTWAQEVGRAGQGGRAAAIKPHGLNFKERLQPLELSGSSGSAGSLGRRVRPSLEAARGAGAESGNSADGQMLAAIQPPSGQEMGSRV